MSTSTNTDESGENGETSESASERLDELEDEVATLRARLLDVEAEVSGFDPGAGGRVQAASVKVKRVLKFLASERGDDVVPIDTLLGTCDRAGLDRAVASDALDSLLRMGEVYRAGDGVKLT